MSQHLSAICGCVGHMLTHLSFSLVKLSFSCWRNVCKSHRREMADQHCSLESEWPLKDAPMHTLQLMHLFKFVSKWVMNIKNEHVSSGGTCVTCIFWMLPAAQPNIPCHQTPEHPLPNLPVLPPPFPVAMAACPPRCSELPPPRHTKTVFSHEAVVCVILRQQQSPSFLTVVLLQHFFVQQLGHHIIFHIHQEKDIWEIDRAPGLTSKPWPSTLTYRCVQVHTVHTLWCQPKKLNRGDSCRNFYFRIYQPVLWLQHVACRTSMFDCWPGPGLPGWFLNLLHCFHTPRRVFLVVSLPLCRENNVIPHRMEPVRLHVHTCNLCAFDAMLWWTLSELMTGLSTSLRGLIFPMFRSWSSQQSWELHRLFSKDLVIYYSVSNWHTLIHFTTFSFLSLSHSISTSTSSRFSPTQDQLLSSPAS